jgi:membrane protease YdiL (CAAX protease family)
MPRTSSPTSSRRSRRSRRRGLALALWLGLATLLVLSAFSTRTGGDQPEDALYDPDLALGGTIFYGLAIGLAFGIVSLAFPRPRRALGLTRFEPRFLWWSLGLIVATIVLAVTLEPLLHAGEEQGFAPEEWQPEHAEVFVANALVTSLVGPFAEELFFRGLGVRVLAAFGTWAAIAVSAVVFGLVHGLLVALPTLVLFGAGLAWLRFRSRSLWPCIAAHVGYNGLGIVLLILSWAAGTPT